jgi:hypothetical protein
VCGGRRGVGMGVWFVPLLQDVRVKCSLILIKLQWEFPDDFNRTVLDFLATIKAT